MAIVLFPTLDKVRLVSNVIDAEPAARRIGMPLKLVWERAGNAMMVPRFIHRMTTGTAA